jgi:hypothetical protein
MKLAILSIPHTGTNFVYNLVGGQLPIVRRQFEEANEHDVIPFHIFNYSVFEEAEQNGFTIITPLRHPIAAAKSWVNWWTIFYQDGQGWHPDLTEEEKEDLIKRNSLSVFFKMFNNLIACSSLYDINFLPLDSENRQEYLDMLNKELGTHLTTEWKPINSIGQHTKEIPQNVLEEAEELINNNKEFFNKFYKV